MNPKISIIVPVYNLEKYISRCLDSILTQTYTDFECICVNDGSTDNSLNIIKEYAANDERVVVYSQENQGICAVRAFALHRSRGEFIIWVDGDDYLANDAIGELIAKQENTNADIVIAQYYLKTSSEKGESVLRKGNIFKERDVIREVINIGRFFLWGKIFRRRIFEGIVFPININYAEDMCILLQCLQNAGSVVALDKPIYYYCRHSANITSVPTKFTLYSWYKASEFSIGVLGRNRGLYKKEISHIRLLHIDTYLTHINITGFYRKNLRRLILCSILNGTFFSVKISGSSKIRLLLCLISQRVAVLFGKMYNKLIHHV